LALVVPRSATRSKRGPRPTRVHSPLEAALACVAHPLCVARPPEYTPSVLAPGSSPGLGTKLLPLGPIPFVKKMRRQDPPHIISSALLRPGSSPGFPSLLLQKNRHPRGGTNLIFHLLEVEKDDNKQPQAIPGSSPGARRGPSRLVLKTEQNGNGKRKKTECVCIGPKLLSRKLAADQLHPPQPLQPAVSFL
jgi:hypothetical protein